MSDVYYSIPASEGQLIANDLSKFNSITLNESINKDEAIGYNQITIDRSEIENIRDKVKKILPNTT